MWSGTHHVNNKCLFFLARDRFQHVVCQNTPLLNLLWFTHWLGDSDTWSSQNRYLTSLCLEVYDPWWGQDNERAVRDTGPTANLSKLLELFGDPLGEVCWKATPKKFCTFSFPWGYGRFILPSTHQQATFRRLPAWKNVMSSDFFNEKSVKKKPLVSWVRKGNSILPLKLWSDYDFLDPFRENPKWMFPHMVVPPFHTPKWSFLGGKTNGCWGNPPFSK